MSYHHEFAHAVVRGAGYAAGRDAFHQLGWVGIAALFLLALLFGGRSRR